MKELLPTQEKALCVSPSWVNHGHWIEREDGTITLTRMVMHQLQDPPKDDDWIGLELNWHPPKSEEGSEGRYL